MDLNRIAVDGLVDSPGAYRQTAIKIKGSTHKPPPWSDVPTLVDEMCEYVNENWGKTAVHLAAYVMWRLNWIHPFADGNGRTSRAASYLVLLARLKCTLPGDKTVPQQIASDKQPYYDALEAADRACADGRLDLTVMEEFLDDLLAKQVAHAANTTWSERESEPVESVDPVRIVPSEPSTLGIEAHRSTSDVVKAAWMQASATTKAAVIGVVGLILAAVIAGLFQMYQSSGKQPATEPATEPAPTPPASS